MHNLTPDGAEQKQNELYALSDHDLLLEAGRISEDFVAWVKNNFSLTQDQEDYLNGLSEKVSKAWGGQLAAVVIGRGKIIIVPPPDKPRRTKQTGLEVIGEVRHVPDKDPEFSLSATITYYNPG